MKIAPELLALAREHYRSLVLANKAINTANKGNNNDILALCLLIVNNFEQDYHNHFAVEEQAVFAPISKINPTINDICIKLIQEHTQLLQLAKSLKTKPENLAQFGELLKSHTRTEDRELFPHINLLTQKELKNLERLSNA